MDYVYRPMEEFNCRACGSTHDGQSDVPGLCRTCARRFRYWSRGKEDENTLNQYLARKIFLDLKRLKIKGITGRCEAVSNNARSFLYDYSTQCAGYAVATRDGRRVCTKHLEAKNPIYVGTQSADTYEELRMVLIHLAFADSRFRDSLIAAIDGSAEAAAAE